MEVKTHEVNPSMKALLWSLTDSASRKLTIRWM